MPVDRNVQPEAFAKKRLIFLWTYTQWGGAQIYLSAIMKLAKKDWDMLILLPRGSSPDLLVLLDELEVPYELADIRFDPTPESTLTGKVLRQCKRIRSEIRTLLYLRRFDLRQAALQIDIAPWQSWQFLVLLALLGANTFVTIHNFRPEVSRLRAFAWKTRFAILSRLPGFHLFASNADTKESLRNWLPKWAWQKIRVAKTSIDPIQINDASIGSEERSQYRERFGIRPDEFVILTVGQFVDRKGRWVLLDAAKEVRRQGIPMRFVWVMPAPIKDADQIRIEALELGATFLPILSGSIGSGRAPVLKFFNIADVFVLPSFIEGLPGSLLEAMALGIPSISTNVYAIPEAVRNHETGLLVDPGNSGELYKAIIRLYNDPGLRSKLSEAGRSFILQNFDERDTAALYLKAYDAALSEKTY